MKKKKSKGIILTKVHFPTRKTNNSTPCLEYEALPNPEWMY